MYEKTSVFLRTILSYHIFNKSSRTFEKKGVYFFVKLSDLREGSNLSKSLSFLLIQRFLEEGDAYHFCDVLESTERQPSQQITFSSHLIQRFLEEGYGEKPFCKKVSSRAPRAPRAPRASYTIPCITHSITP